MFGSQLAVLACVPSPTSHMESYRRWHPALPSTCLQQFATVALALAGRGVVLISLLSRLQGLMGNILVGLLWAAGGNWRCPRAGACYVRLKVCSFSLCYKKHAGTLIVRQVAAPSALGSPHLLQPAGGGGRLAARLSGRHSDCASHQDGRPREQQGALQGASCGVQQTEVSRAGPWCAAAGRRLADTRGRSWSGRLSRNRRTSGPGAGPRSRGTVPTTGATTPTTGCSASACLSWRPAGGEA